MCTLPNPPYREGPKGPGTLDTRKLGGSLQRTRKEAGFGGGPALFGLPAVIPQALPCEGFRHRQYGGCAGCSRATDERRSLSLRDTLYYRVTSDLDAGWLLAADFLFARTCYVERLVQCQIMKPYHPKKI